MTAPAVVAAEAGYSTAPTKVPLITRLRRSRTAMVGAVLFVFLIVAVVIGSRPVDYTPLSTGNATPNGARAVAQVLRDQGVSVRQTTTLGGARITEPSSTTLVIAASWTLADYQAASVAAYPGDIVFLGVGEAVLDALESEFTIAQVDHPTVETAQCADPHALAAGSVRVEGEGLTDDAEASAELCFADAAGVSAYGVMETELGTRTFIATYSLATNGALADEGHAALALRSMGHHPTVVWYVSEGFDSSTLTWSSKDDPAPPPDDDPGSGSSGNGGSSSGGSSQGGSGQSGSGQAGNGGGPNLDAVGPDHFPPGTGTALYALALAAILAAVWRARRFGPLITEPLPVVVRSSESTRGRARLYRRARATGRATAALRGAAALRMGKRLGVPRGSAKSALVSAIARASGRPAAAIEHTLYGPPPATDHDMMKVIEELDTLEREVHRP